MFWIFWGGFLCFFYLCQIIIIQGEKGRLFENMTDQPIIQSLVDRIIVKGSQVGWQQEGQKYAAIAYDGSYERDNTAYEEYS